MANRSDLTTKNTSAYAPSTISKVLALLECFSLQEPELTAVEIGSRLGLTTSTLYRYLSAMENEGYLERDPATGRYVIGLRVIELAGIALGRLEVRRHGQIEIDALADSLDMNAQLGVLYKGDTFHLAFAVRTEVNRMYSVIGRRTPAHCTAMGKAMLAHLPRSEAHQMVETYGWRPLTRNSIQSSEQLDTELDAVKQLGYAVDRGEVNPRKWCLAAPVREQGGRVVAAISVTSDRENIESRVEEVAREVNRYAERVSVRLGYAD